MRKFYPLFACCFAVSLVALVSSTQAQTIPNAGMESWSAGNPVGWSTPNDPRPPAIVVVTQSNDAHSGTSAAQGAAILINPPGFVLPPSLISGTNEEGFPISARPAALRGWYKFTSVGGDGFFVSSLFQKNGAGIGAGSFLTTASTTTYSEFVANTIWATGETPDTAYIVVTITPAGGVWHAGSTFWVDDLAYGAAADVRDETAGIPNTFALHQNYPNPFNPSTTIRYELPQASHVSLSVFNLVGQEVAVLVNGERAPGMYAAQFNATNLPSGTYFYRLSASSGQTGSFSEVKKLMVVK